MISLGIDASGKVAGVALVQDGELLGELTLSLGLTHSETLLPACISLLEQANAAGADVYLTADLRHHPATDHLWNSGCALVCATHWASEWPLLGEMARSLVESLGSSAPEVYVSKIPTDPWNIVVRQ